MASTLPQCLLFVAHRGNLPEHSSDMPPVQREQIDVYVLLPRIERYEDLREIFVSLGITVLRNSELSTSLSEAVKTNRVEMVEIVFDKTTFKTPHQLTVLGHQCNTNILRAVLTGRRNLALGSLASLLRTDYKNIDFFSFVDDRNLDIIRSLTSLRADIRYKHNVGGHFLHFAIRRKVVALVRLLLEQGADVNVMDGCGLSPLHLAVQYKAPAFILDLLLQKGADINATNLDGATPLHLALRPRRVHLVEHLLNNGASMDAESNRGNVLQLAMESNDPLILNCVLSRHLDLNDDRNHAVFRKVVRAVKKEAIQMMTDAGFRLVPSDVRDAGLLRGACACPQLIEDLLKWGAAVYFPPIPPNEEAACLKRLLTQAMEYCYMESVRFLLNLGDNFSRRSYVSVLKSAILVGNARFVSDVLNSADLGLDLIWGIALGEDKKVRSPLVRILNEGLPSFSYHLQGDRMSETICRYVHAVRAANFSANNACFRGKERTRIDLPPWLVKVLRSPPPENYRVQVAAMKNEIIPGSNLSFCDILNMSAPRMARILRNCDIPKPEGYADKFPAYSSMIEWRFRKAFYRKKLLEEGVHGVAFLFRQYTGRVASDEIEEKILNYLCNLDLLVFVHVSKDLKNSSECVDDQS